MRPNFRSLNNRAKSMLRGTTLLAGIGAVFVATAPAYAADADAIETVVVTGYRASLTASTDAKRASTNFTDSIFAEDIGKFPDTNIAESFNRVPGVTIIREVDGEGVDIQIRGLGTSFTKVLLNNAQVAMSSTGATDSQNTNREVDLNMLPVELFTQLTVAKSPTADMVEGGAAGTVNMRSMRPFDKPGMHLTYSFQGTQSSADHAGTGPRGTLIASDTEGPFGFLFGITGQINHQYTTGFETIGWTTPKLNAAMCPAADCNLIGGGNWTVPANVPNNVTTGGLVPGALVNQALLTSLNPGLTVEQISNALIPRLGRAMYEKGTRSRFNGIASFEYRPTESLHFYVDFIGGRLDNNLDRSDMDWVGRNGAMIPEKLALDANGVVTSGVFANAQFFLEARPYKEKEDFVSVNPGMDWKVTDMLDVSLQFNATRSHFFRDSPTILVITTPSAGNAAGVPGPTPPVGGVVVNYTNTGLTPTIGTNLDLNNPANFEWNGGRVNVQDEQRYTYTDGSHFDVSWGGDKLMVKGGAAFDDAYRSIKGYDNSQAWQNAICGDNPSVFVPSPNAEPPCQGLNTATPNPVPGGYPTYPGLGTNYTAGHPATFTYQGSLIPQSALAGYLSAGPAGFITANYAKIEKDAHYASFDFPNAPLSTGTNTGASGGLVDEKNYGAYLEANGVFNIDNRDLRYNVGLRFVETHQTIGGYVSHADNRNVPLTATAALTAANQGGLYPNFNTFTLTKNTYGSFLPSLNVVYSVADDFQVRGSISRTMTRPNPSSMLPGVGFGDPSAAQATIGNPALAPFYSNNIDLGAELYTGGEGYIGASIFRKGLSGFTVLGNTTEPFSFLAQYGIMFSTVSPTQQTALIARGCTSDTTCPTTVIIQKQVNAQGLLTVNGIELDWVQPLDFLLADYGLKGFGITANLTIVDQKGSGAAPAIATGVAPFTYNLTGYYENHGASVRLSYNFVDRTYSSGSNQNGICLPSTAAAGCPGGAFLFGAPYGQLDFSSSLKLSEVFGDLPSDPELTFDIQNLTKSKLRSFFQYPSAPFTVYNQGSLFMFGLRGSF
ncbi:MAG TPA: TonB-dependent receptor [Rhizomicrobium sp.]